MLKTAPLQSWFILFVLLSAMFSVGVSPDVAMILGFVVGLVPGLGAAVKQTATTFSKHLLGFAIVMIGFTLNFLTLAATGWNTLWVTVISIFAVVLLGVYLGERLLNSKTLGLLLGSGTAICGASAISAVGSAIGARATDMALALGVVLVFNSIALLSFPWLGHLLELSPVQFGIWAGLAIHDTSSVVGAASIYSHDSLEVASTVKLARAVWIVPLAAFAARKFGQRVASTKIPWFIWGFVGASALGTVIGLPDALMEWLEVSAKRLLASAIFLVGAAISLKSLREVGQSSIVVGAILWVASAVISLIYIKVFLS